MAIMFHFPAQGEAVEPVEDVMLVPAYPVDLYHLALVGLPDALELYCLHGKPVMH